VPRRYEASAGAGGESPKAEREGDEVGGEGVSGCRSASGNDLTAAKTARRKKLFLAAFERNACDVYAACRATDIGRRTVFNWRKADPEFEEAFIEINERDLDFTESQLKKNIKSGKEASIFFHLKCKGKARGWVERQEFTGAEGVPLYGGISATDEQRLRSLSLDDLKRIRDIIRNGNADPGSPTAGPDRQADSGEEPPRVH
jgi:hypothetical protein